MKRTSFALQLAGLASAARPCAIGHGCVSWQPLGMRQDQTLFGAFAGTETNGHKPSRRIGRNLS